MNSFQGRSRRLATAPLRVWHSTARYRKLRCRFAPSCSEYAIESIEIHGIIRGLYLSLRRVSKCHPWGGQGFDPVPAPRGHVRKAA